MKRLAWIDMAKGLAILFVVYFHFFRTVFEHYQPPAADWSNVGAAAVSILRAAWWQISGLGFHAVGAFIILSGWTLMQSTTARAEAGHISWGKWYFARFTRLYPMYWVAHLVYLVSPFIARLEPVDSRIVLSLLGLRFINIEENFMYLNAAWWYFSMLIQFYLIFPLLFLAARKFGAWIFLLLACALGFGVRYWMLDVHPVHGLWTLGGFAICRLPEFALGMALGMWHARPGSRIESVLLNGPGLIAGILFYPLALKLYSNGVAYVFCDLGTGLCCFLALVGISGLILRVASLAKLIALVGMYSYGLYLIHQPYVIWLGLKIRPLSILTFILVFIATAAALSAWGIVLEKATNAFVSRVLPARKPAPLAS